MMENQPSAYECKVLREVNNISPYFHVCRLKFYLKFRPLTKAIFTNIFKFRFIKAAFPAHLDGDKRSSKDA